MSGTVTKSLLFLAGGLAAAALTAYAFGVFDPYFSKSPVAVTTTSEPAGPGAEARAGRLPGQEPAPEPEQAATSESPSQPEAAASAPASADLSDAAETKPETKTPKVLAPAFDIVRAESNGSIVIAGRAAPKSRVEIVIGAQVIGNAVAGPEGDFAVALETPLKPGGHQIVIRSTTPDNVVATSPETAIVSIPETRDGQVLALVEKPGAPSRLISVPEAATPGEAAPEPQDGEQAAQPSPGPASAAGDNQPASQKSAAAPAAPEAGATPAAVTGVNVEAVEIDGRKIFVAGTAEPGRKVRAYANETLLGEAITSPGGRFLIEAERDLPVGDYIVRVDALEPDGVKVVARAAVPFEREPGEAISAVASPAAKGPEEKAGGDGDANEPSPSSSGETAVPETLAPKLESADGSVIIRRGDSLWRISRRVYGLGVRYSTIYLANQQQIRDPDLIWPGQVFKVPGKTSQGETADMKAIEGQATTAQ